MNQPIASWPALPRYSEWQETCTALHLWSQIVGKYRFARSPWVNHSWQATLYVVPRGLTTGPVPDGERSVTVLLDLVDSRLVAEADGGATADFALASMSVADFWRQTRQAITNVGGNPRMHGRPNELPNPIRFADDTAVRPYDAEAVQRYHTALLRIARVFELFRTSFIGKVSPVHLFWGAFDLAVTRFSGCRGPLHPGGFPALPDSVTREAYSHEVSPAGFWPGGNGVEEAMFLSYANPEPAGFRARPVKPEQATFFEPLGEYLVPYAAIQSAADPQSTLLQSTYEAAAECAGWDRANLECHQGRPRIPRPM